MTRNRKTVQLSLVAIGTFLILATYFFYPKVRDYKTDQEQAAQTNLPSIDDDQSNTFENIEYKGLYNLDNPFSIKSEKAHILAEEPDIVYMINIKTVITMNDGRIIEITSNKGRYNKLTYDCFFEENVKASDGETEVFSENLDLIATQDFISIYNNVSLKNEQGSLYADKVDYDLNTKRYKVSMFDDKRVKIKLIK